VIKHDATDIIGKVAQLPPRLFDFLTDGDVWLRCLAKDWETAPRDVGSGGFILSPERFILVRHNKLRLPRVNFLDLQNDSPSRIVEAEVGGLLGLRQARFELIICEPV
jgi:hypothetical protein